MTAKIIRPHWPTVDVDTAGERLASVTVLAGRTPHSRRHPAYLDGNDGAAFDRFVERIRSLTDAELANAFHVSDPSVIVALRELAS